MGLFRRPIQTNGLCRLSDNCNNSERSSRRFIKTNEAPYQIVGRRTWADTFGHRELSSGHFWLSVLSESVSCYLYVFITCATRVSWTGSIIGHEPNLVAMSVASGATMMLLMLMFRTVHVNPALTLAFLLTGRIPVIRAVIYILVHCVSSVAAIALLYSISVTGHAGALGMDNPHPSLETWQILLIEFVISFVVTLATYSTCSYSSYTNARQFILEQVGQNYIDTLDLRSTTSDNENLAGLSEVTSNHFRNQQNNCNIPIMSQTAVRPNQQHRPALYAQQPSHATAARKPIGSTNFRVHPQSKWNQSELCENSDFDYEYDNHRIYTHQQQSSPESPSSSRAPPIEDLMHLESQLLAPNGFSFLMTPCQSFIIGLAYTLASFTGIPASGASLNPARSFGPAFFMNRWENHWIFWLGPIMGAAVAGLLYEFIFNPTRSSSLCYLPKLFRLSAHDMAKVGSRTRSYQKTINPIMSQSESAAIFPTIATNLRPTQAHHFPTIQHSPARHQTATNLMSHATLMNPSTRDPKHQPLIGPSTSLAYLQPSQFTNNKFDQLNYPHTQQQQRQLHNEQLAHEAANLDHRSNSTAIMNLIASKHQQSAINVPGRSNFHSVSSSNGSANQDFVGANSNVQYENPSGQLPVPLGSGGLFAPALQTIMFGPAAKLQQQQRQQLATSRPLRPISQTIGGEQQSAPGETLRRRSIAAFNQAGSRTSAVRPFGHSEVGERDENFYQLPSDEFEEFDGRLGGESSRRRPPGGSTGEASQSNSSADQTTNEANSNGTIPVGDSANSSGANSNDDQNEYYKYN